jgi:plastocyanin
MIRLFLAALLPSLLAFLTLPVLAFSSAHRPELRAQERQPPQAVAAKVVIQDASFEPDQVQVEVGESVTWTNESDRDHLVVLVRDQQESRSPAIKSGKSWTRKFTAAGTYEFHCFYHARAKGTLKVVPASRR